MNENGLTPQLTAALDVTELNPEEQAALQQKLWNLLVRRSRLYTMDDSSSLRVELAQELFASVCFLLSLHLRQTGASLRVLLQGDEHEVLRQAISTARRKTEQTRQYYEAVCGSLPQAVNECRTETLQSIGAGFARYDLCYFAHTFPCSIDYPLCLPVSERTLGIEYIQDYLSRLMIENHFLRQFEPRAVQRLLSAAYPDYKELPLNQCEPVLANALGRVLCRQDPGPLNLSAEEKAQLLRRFGGLPQAEIAPCLRQAAERLCRTLALEQPGICAYLGQAAANLGPYLEQALALGSLDRIFYSWPS